MTHKQAVTLWNKIHIVQGAGMGDTRELLGVFGEPLRERDKRNLLEPMTVAVELNKRDLGRAANELRMWASALEDTE